MENVLNKWNDYAKVEGLSVVHKMEDFDKVMKEENISHLELIKILKFHLSKFDLSDNYFTINGLWITSYYDLDYFYGELKDDGQY